jgi:uncharacterized repeat protein (TIGR01451 family)
MTASISGKAIIYSITVTNSGPAAVLNAFPSNPLPAGTGFVSVVSSMGTCSGGKTVTCDCGKKPFLVQSSRRSSYASIHHQNRLLAA